MQEGDISNEMAPYVAFNCAAMFDVQEKKLPFGFTYGSKLVINRFAAEAHMRLRRMSVNRMLLVEKPEIWRAVENWRASEASRDFEPTLIFPIFYPDHYATMRANMPLLCTLWTGDDSPGYDDIINEAPNTGWSVITDLAKRMER